METSNKEGIIEPTFSRPIQVPKGWGFETHLVNNAKYCGKLLVFGKGKKMSLHMHKLKEEHFYVINGSFIFKYFDFTKADLLEKNIGMGDIVGIPQMCLHQLEALEDNSIIVEISTQDFPFDSYRVGKGHSQEVSSV